MKDSREMQRKQTTSCGHEGSLRKVGVERRDSAEVPSISPASERRRNDMQEVGDDLLEWILSRDNLNLAYKRVKANKGSHGVDGMKVDELLSFLKQHGETLRQSILVGEYVPQPVRRVEIPKPDGGVRLLGIPTVVDRLIQQAMAQELNKIFDPDFSENSYGFRTKKSAHQAVIAARGYIE